jgi:hypothetical protein
MGVQSGPLNKLSDLFFFIVSLDSPKNVSEVVRKLRSNIPQSRCKLESFVNLEKTRR